MNQKTKHKREKIILENTFLDLVNASKRGSFILKDFIILIWNKYFKSHLWIFGKGKQQKKLKIYLRKSGLKAASL